MKKPILVPQYLHLRFKSEEDFKSWLDSVATKRITFVDEGQDLQEIFIDDRGEVLHADLQSSIWCGKFFNVDTFREGSPVEMWDREKGQWKTMQRLVIEGINSLEIVPA